MFFFHFHFLIIDFFYPWVASLTPAQSHLIGEMDHDESSLASLLYSAESRLAFIICTKYWLTALSSLPNKKCGVHVLRL